MKKTKKLLAGLLTAFITLSSMGINVSAQETETAQASFNVGARTVKVGDYYKALGKAYWLRTPSPYGSSVRYIDTEGNVPRTDANTAEIGIRPAFYLDTAAANISDGTGTEIDAYVINGDGVIDVNDVTICLQMAAGSIEKDIDIADMNNDANVTSVDAYIILTMIV